jgi:hypothetical protein
MADRLRLWLGSRILEFMKKSPRRLSRTITLGLVLLPPFALAPAGNALAQPFVGQTRGPAQRVVQGKVTDKSGAGIKGAVVYLKDDRSNQVKSAISEDDGSYRFVQLSLSTDYEVWAQNGSKKSKTKSISSFDSKPDITLTLQID